MSSRIGKSSTSRHRTYPLDFPESSDDPFELDETYTPDYHRRERPIEEDDRDHMIRDRRGREQEPEKCKLDDLDDDLGRDQDRESERKKDRERDIFGDNQPGSVVFERYEDREIDPSDKQDKNEDVGYGSVRGSVERNDDDEGCNDDKRRKEDARSDDRHEDTDDKDEDQQNNDFDLKESSLPRSENENNDNVNFDYDDGRERENWDNSKSRQRTIKEGFTSSPPREWKQELIRAISLYLVPVIIVVPVSLVLYLTTRLLTPLYNSLPLQLHTPLIYALWTPVVPLYMIIHHTVRSRSSSSLSSLTSRRFLGAWFSIDARTSLTIAALAGDFVSVYGRDIASACGRRLGPILGASVARYMLGIGLTSGATAFALLCFDHLSPLQAKIIDVKSFREKVQPRFDLPFLLGALSRAAVYIAHIWAAERAWSRIFSLSSGSWPQTLLVGSPETSILAVSFILTLLSLFVRASPTSTTSLNLPNPLRRIVPPQTSTRVSSISIFLLIRLPLLVLSLRQHLFLRPAPPFTTISGDLRVLSSVESLTGRVVVADNIKDGYRFLRCDHSILGGNWVKWDSKGKAQLGDSIFATFPLQEVAVLVDHGPRDSGARRTIELSTGESFTDEDSAVKLASTKDSKERIPPKRALIIGLGVGIGAVSFSQRGFDVDIIEIDPAIYLAAKKYFHLSSFPPRTVHLTDGAKFIHSAANLSRARSNPMPNGLLNESETKTQLLSEDADSSSSSISGQKWSVVVQDCYSGGSVPFELFTKEFWEDVVEVLDDEGIVVINYAGIRKSQSAKMAFATLLSVFPQCRAFGDVMEKRLNDQDLTNMVIICTPRQDPILTFRRPTASDVLRSPIRSHVFSTFLQHEISLSDMIGWSGEELEELDSLLLRSHLSEEGQEQGQGYGDAKGSGGWLDAEQRQVAVAAWKAMQNLLTPEMWKAY